jgi:hypothetical protein
VTSSQSGIHNIRVVFSPTAYLLSEDYLLGFVFLSQNASRPGSSLPRGDISYKPQCSFAVDNIHIRSFAESINHDVRLVVPQCFIKYDLRCKANGEVAAGVGRFEMSKKDLENREKSKECGNFEGASKCESTPENLRVVGQKHFDYSSMTSGGCRLDRGCKVIVKKVGVNAIANQEPDAGFGSSGGSSSDGMRSWVSGDDRQGFNKIRRFDVCIEAV